jgi:hypothetical protein
MTALFYDIWDDDEPTMESSSGAVAPRPGGSPEADGWPETAPQLCPTGALHVISAEAARRERVTALLARIRPR